MRWKSAAAIAVLTGLFATTAPVGAAGSAGSAGYLDPTFGSGGVVIVPTTSTGNDPIAPTAEVARAPSGRLYVLSVRSHTISGHATVLAEMTAFTPSGRLDSTFHRGRPVVLTHDEMDIQGVDGPFVTSTGGVVAVVRRIERTTVIRLTRSGSPDPSFSGNGVASLRAPTSYTALAATMLAGGSTRWVENGYPKANWLSGLTPTGAIDTRIGPGSLRKLPVEGIPFAIEADASGHLDILNWREGEIDVIRTNSSGDPDPTWGSGGIVTVAIPNVIASGAVVPAPTGGAYVAVDLLLDGTPPVDRSVVVQLDATGAPVAGFGAGGTQVVPTTGERGSVSAITVDTHGRLVVAFLKLGPTRSYVTRLDGTTGNVDTTFGASGLISTSGLTSDVLDTGSRLLTVGRSSVDGRVRIVLAGRHE